MKKLNSSLKVTIIFSILLFSLISCNKTETDPYKQMVFQDGLPETFKLLEKDLPFENFSYSNLETGTDTLQVFFGKLMQGTTKGYWLGVESNGIPAHFSSVGLEEVDTLNYQTKDIDLNFNEERNRISVRVIKVDSLNIKYSWLDNTELSENLVLKQIEKPLRKDIQFPIMNLESMSGEKISSNQFKDKFIVINWWATWCKPCREEIPGLNEMAKKYSENDNVRFIAITDDPKSRIIDFLKTHEFNYEMTFADQAVRTLFGNTYPVNLIIDPKGKISYLTKGAHSNTPGEIHNFLKLQMEAYKREESLISE